MRFRIITLILGACCLLGCPSEKQHKSGDGHDHAAEHKSGDGHDHAAEKSGEHKSGDGHNH